MEMLCYLRMNKKNYQKQGIEAFLAHEKMNPQNPLSAGLFVKLLRTLSDLQRQFSREESLIRTEIVTA